MHKPNSKLKPKIIRKEYLKLVNRIEVPFYIAEVETDTLTLWPDNNRISLYRDEFAMKMTDKDIEKLFIGNLSGIAYERKEEFKIKSLADDISKNGLEKRLILDKNHTLIDGNRRLSAIRHIKSSNKFSQKDKERVKIIEVLILSNNTDKSMREHVIRSVNFQKDYRLQWPQYIINKDIYDQYLKQNSDINFDYNSFLTEAELMFGIKKSDIKIAIRIMEQAEEFRTYNKIKRRSMLTTEKAIQNNFNCFDELSRGINKNDGENNVYKKLEKEPEHKELFFDLIHKGKIKAKTIRMAGELIDNKKTLQWLQEARQSSREDGIILIDKAIAEVNYQREAKKRYKLINNRFIEIIEWLEQLPEETYQYTKRKNKRSSKISKDNFYRLITYFKKIERLIKK